MMPFKDSSHFIVHRPDLGQPRMLAQARPNTATVVALYSPAQRAIIKRVIICNTTAGASLFRMYLDDDGSTFDESTALFWDKTVAAGETIFQDAYWAMDNPDGNVGVRSATAQALTYTLFGDEIRIGR